VKLVVSEAETQALAQWLESSSVTLASSRLAMVEVTRAVGIANPDPEVRDEAERLIAACLLIDVSEKLLRSAAKLASTRIRSLDAIHLASAEEVDADAMVVYDERLAAAARARRIPILQPGREGHSGTPWVRAGLDRPDESDDAELPTPEDERTPKVDQLD
jgi:predicted nucleic acid-binding protein